MHGDTDFYRDAEAGLPEMTWASETPINQAQFWG
jgi:hypothetical protein